MEPRKEQAVRCLPEWICRVLCVCVCQSFWWAVKSHQGPVIWELTPVKTHMVLVKAEGNWIKENSSWNSLDCSCQNNCERLTQMKPQISLKLIFSFSFSCHVSHNSGMEAVWTLSSAERWGGRRSGPVSIAYYFSFPNKTPCLHHMLSINGKLFHYWHRVYLVQTIRAGK